MIEPNYEEWRDVVGFEGSYQVSSLGKVRSVPRQRRHWRGGTMIRPGRVLKLRASDNRVTAGLILPHCKVYPYLVARLVLEAFVGPCPEGMECCHEDDNFRNNCLGNLRWDTHLNNLKDRDRNGRTARGDRHGSRSRLTDDQFTKVRELLSSGYSQRRVARMFGVSNCCISGRMSRYKRRVEQLSL